MKRSIALLLLGAMLPGLCSGCARTGPEAADSPGPIQTQAISVSETQSVVEALPAADIRITEVMPDNRLLTLGCSLDWVELYNAGEETATLDGYCLTDNPDGSGALALTGLSVAPGDYLVVLLEKDSPFQLSEMGETVYLTCREQVVSALTFDRALDGRSFDEDGLCEFATPGYANTADGYRACLEETALPGLIISEVMPDNGTQGQFGYVEINNRSDSPVNLGEYYLTDRWESTKRYSFPNITLAPGGYYVVYCSGDPDLGEDHAPFGLSSDGETVYLAHRGSFVDALAFPGDLTQGESYGRSDNVPVYLDSASPGSANGSGILVGVNPPVADTPSGEYAQAVAVSLNGEGNIFYTLDGSVPTAASTVYQGPIVIDGVTTLRAVCINGSRTSSVANYTYIVGKSHDLPILVISLPTSSRELLMEKFESSQEYESLMTLFEDGQEKFSVPLGIRLHGNDSRKGAKKNFQLRFRGEYGAGKLKYRLFDTRDIDEFDSLLLKSGSEDYKTAMVRDELAAMIVDGSTALYTQAVKPVVLYLGGEYWGIYYLRERFSDEYVASHLEVSPESVDLLYSTSGSVQTGSRQDFNALKSYVKNSDMTTTENFLYLADRIDINSLIDWYVCRTYLDDRDLANIRRFRSCEGDGKWRWMFFDMDWGLYQQSARPISDILEDYNGEPILIKGLLASQAGRDAFLTRYAYLMRTTLNEAHINACLNTLLAQIESEMPADRERWGQNMAWWEANVEYIREFARDDVRVQLVLNDIRNYFLLTDEQMTHYFGDLWSR